MPNYRKKGFILESGDENMKDLKKVSMGKKSRAAGQRFELKVRKDIERRGIVSKWQNNVDLDKNKCIPAKRKYNPFKRAYGVATGFPDFIAYFLIEKAYYRIIFVESKINGKLDKIEMEKARWYLRNNYCSKFLIASKGEKRGEINYKEVKNE